LKGDDDDDDDDDDGDDDKSNIFYVVKTYGFDMIVKLDIYSVNQNGIGTSALANY
jgi:hypothetical protein